MDKDKRNKKDNRGSESWIMTFADLLSLMLTFFVLTFAMNEINVQKWTSVMQSFREEFNPYEAKVQTEEAIDQQRIKQEAGLGLNLAYLATILQLEMEQEPLLKGGRAQVSGSKLVISFPAKVLFDDKEAILFPEVKKSFGRFGTKLALLNNKILIAGHTDLRPVVNGKFRSNWELSITRANNVAAILASSGYKRPITILGYADSRYDEMDEKWSEDDRQLFAERVELILLEEEQEGGPYDIF